MKPQRITVHCSATKNGQFLDISEIEKWHLARGFIMVGYHGVIQPNGEWQQGRGNNVKGAHVSGENDGNIGICLIGDTKFSAKQFDCLKDHIDSYCQIWDVEPWNIFCHYQFKSAIEQGKTCPNIPINNLLAWYLLNDKKALTNYLL